jgi:hypothetical protein
LAHPDQGDELGHFARVFKKMVIAMQERERQLKEQVQKLSIQIDEVRRQEELDHIVKGEFFQNLQGKAKEMRKKKEEQAEKKEY